MVGHIYVSLGRTCLRATLLCTCIERDEWNSLECTHLQKKLVTLKLVLNYKLVAFNEIRRTQRAIGFICAVISVVGNNL